MMYPFPPLYAPLVKAGLVMLQNLASAGGAQARMGGGLAGRSRIEIPSGSPLTAPQSPRAFVPFNQYVIKLKSQLKNLQQR